VQRRDPHGRSQYPDHDRDNDPLPESAVVCAIAGHNASNIVAEKVERKECARPERGKYQMLGSTKTWCWQFAFFDGVIDPHVEYNVGSCSEKTFPRISSSQECRQNVGIRTQSEILSGDRQDGFMFESRFREVIPHDHENQCIAVSAR
jgi:hypothetical protein